MLPRDSKRRKQETAEDLRQSQQRLDPHLREREQVIPYSDARFCEAALDWLVETDQVSNLGRFCIRNSDLTYYSPSKL
jgi:hypothetical protein